MGGYAPLPLVSDLQADIELFDQNGSVPVTPLFSPLTTALYLVTAYALVQSTGAGSVDAEIEFNDGFSNRTSPILGTLILASLANFSVYEQVVRVAEDTLATYKVTMTGAGGTYALFIHVKPI